MKRLGFAVCRLLFIAFSFIAPAALVAQVVSHTVNINYPADAGMINVKSAPYSAAGDGVTDDTAAIRAAINATGINTGVYWWQDKVVYFPNGTYLVSDELLKQYSGSSSCNGYSGGACASGMILVGQSQSGVTIKLKDGATGYGSATSPKPVIFTASKSGFADGHGADAYRNSIENMTINVGNNAGANGISYLANNVGDIRNVTITAPSGSGVTAIELTRDSVGPSLIQNVTINGFQYGFDVARTEYGITLEHISLINQTVAAVRNANNELAINYLKTSGSVPALLNTTANGLVVLSNSALQNSITSGPEITNTGTIVFHKSTSAGSSSFTGGGGSTLEGTLTNGAWTPASSSNYDIPTLLGYANDTLIDTPVPDYDTSGWINVQNPTFGGVAIADYLTSSGTLSPSTVTAADDGAALQAALNAATMTNGTVYFPRGVYYTAEHLTVPANVRRIVGMDSTIRVTNVSTWDPTNTFAGVFVVNAAASTPLVIEHLAIDGTLQPNTPYAVSSSAVRDVVLRDIATNAAYLAYRSSAGGRLFMEDVCCGPIRINGTGSKVSNLVAGRQFDTETKGYGRIRVINNGAPLWMLGLKVEAPVNVIDGTNGSVTQILGGVLYTSPSTAYPTYAATTCTQAENTTSSAASTPAAFILNSSWVQASFVEELLENTAPSTYPNYLYPYYVADINTNTCINNSGYIPRSLVIGSGYNEAGFVVPVINGGPSTLPPLYP